jgi:low temperature requirement protein LtrA
VSEAAQHAHDERVGPLELFFDLVFVFALTQVTARLADDPTWGGLLRGILILGAVWWAWVAYAWLTDSVDAEEGGIRLAMFGAMGAMLVVALTVPTAFEDDALVFAVAYLAVRLMHLVLYARGARDDPAVLGAVVRLAPTATFGPALLVLGAFLDDGPQVAAWVGALAVDWIGPALGRGRGWRVNATHFAERHALIVIIALGESVVALGAGAAGLPIDAGLLVTALLGVVILAALWWLYFDVVAIVAERKLSEATGVARALMARDSYSYLHFPMVAGIVLVALALKKTLAHHGDPLTIVPAVGLCGGLALYLLGHVGFRLRNVRSLNRHRLVVAVALVALVPAATKVPALAALAAAAALTGVLVAYEAIRFREARARVRRPQLAG